MSIHHINLVIEDGQPRIKFECTGTPDAWCRRRPEDWEQRGEESWTREEATVTGYECWGVEFIDAAGMDDGLTGVDQILAHVPVEIGYDECVEISPVRDEPLFSADERANRAEAVISDTLAHISRIGTDRHNMPTSNLNGIRAILTRAEEPQGEPSDVMTGEIRALAFEDGKDHGIICGLEDCECPDHDDPPRRAGTYITVRLDGQPRIGLWRVRVERMADQEGEKR